MYSKITRMISFIVLAACLFVSAGFAESFSVTDQAGREVAFEALSLIHI